MTTLFEISNDILDRKDQLQAMLDDGQEPSMDEAMAILGLEDDLQSKLVSYGYVVNDKKLDIEKIDAEIKRLTQMKKSVASSIDKLENTMIYAMKIHSLENIKDAVMPIKLRKNPPSVLIECGLDALPSEFIRTKTTTEADKTALKKALESGLTINGVSLERKTGIKIG